jgi:hypothetical protein
LAARQTGAQRTDLLDQAGQLAALLLQPGLVRGQGRLQSQRVAAQHLSHLGQAETQGAQGHDLAGPRQLVRPIGPPAGRGAPGRNQAALLIEPQGLGRDAQPPGGLGGVQETDGRLHAITSLTADRRPYRGGPRGRVNGRSVRIQC